jgi:ParB family chromosome partitioning protein
VEAELQARAARAETRAQELAARAEQAAREAGLAQAARARVQEVEAQLLAAGQARARLEKELSARATAAEARAADGARRIEQLAAERREAEARAVKAVEEAQARFRDELGRRDQLRAEEIQRLQAALQDRARREKALELELQRAKGGRNVVQQPAGAAPAPAATVTDEE